ncbi:hypothetical protein [Nocardioides gansuensis]|uniref:hypothetical protein n=1 Tax=Nocardioides gansuensis TaxID=2138300 RepID=UPI0010580028|nr:hypothetical protein [Nocardioides gansuensis]
MAGSTASRLGRRLATAVAVVAVGLSGDACDGPVGQPPGAADSPAPLQQLSAEQLLPAVATALAKARTASFTVTVTTTGSDPAVAAGTLALEGVLRLDGRGVDLAASATGDHALEVVLLNRALYVRDEAGGPEWLALDLADQSHPLSLLGRTVDPRRLFAAMGTPPVTFVGEEEVGGVPTHHYTVALDPAAYVAALDLPEGFVRYLPATIPLDLWVDGDHRPVRFRQEVQSVAAAGGAPVITATEGTWSDFGRRVRIVAPPDAETTDDWPGM